MTKYKPDDLLTAAQLAERWGVEVNSLNQQRYKKCGPPYIKAPGCGVRYKYSDIVEYEEAHKMGG